MLKSLSVVKPAGIFIYNNLCAVVSINRSRNLNSGPTNDLREDAKEKQNGRQIFGKIFFSQN